MNGQNQSKCTFASKTYSPFEKHLAAYNDISPYSIHLLLINHEISFSSFYILIFAAAPSACLQDSK